MFSSECWTCWNSTSKVPSGRSFETLSTSNQHSPTTSGSCCWRYTRRPSDSDVSTKPILQRWSTMSRDCRGSDSPSCEADSRTGAVQSSRQWCQPRNARNAATRLFTLIRGCRTRLDCYTVSGKAEGRFDKCLVTCMWDTYPKFHYKLTSYFLDTRKCRRRIEISGCPSAAFVCSSVRSFVRTDLVTTISHKGFEQSGWNLQGIFNSHYCWLD